MTAVCVKSRDWSVRPVIAVLVDSRGWAELRIGPWSGPEVRDGKLVTETRVTAEELWAETTVSQGGRVGGAVEVRVRVDVPAVCRRVECELVASVLGLSVTVRLVRPEEMRV